MKRILWYCEKWQPGGIQAIQTNLLRHFDRETFQFDIVVSEDDTDLFDETLKQYGAQKTVTLKKRYRSPGIRTLHNILALRKLIRDGHYDVAHFNVCHGVELIYSFWAWRYRIPVRIAHCRNNDIGAGGKSRKFKIFCHNVCKRLFRNCTNVKLANSDLAAKWLFCKSDLKHGKVRILKNGIDAERYRFNSEGRERMRRKLGVEENFVVGHIGHFNYQKNHEFLMEITKNLIAIRPGTKLLLIGEGEREESIRELAKRLEIEEHVMFCGVTDNVPPFLWAMDAFVLPSRFEGFGNVLVEAQAAGLKCFASQSVIPEKVKVTEHFTWIPLESGAAVWAQQIAGADDGYVHEDGTQAVIRAGFDLSCMAEALRKLYLQESTTGEKRI